ncbi:hypothetical protein EKG37_01865 [Robertmurraya yapensis]|uniref:TadE-like domain-containing protein n=1 Tax=Bacillus yapensis TaxID=2492960 RepID=A0A431WLJ8_9BACI|nr:hypothetical protein EKG37_01865 [Bacillus yapensis]TKT05830.1 hypothetical protein FAR12_01865 [Bacillus yapensis]
MSLKGIFKRYIKNERGSQAIEFVAMFPLIILSILIIWQIGLIAFSLVVGESAARDGARAAAIHDPDWRAVAERSASGIKVEVSGGPGTVDAHVFVKITAPIVKLPLIGDMEFTYTVDAVMPMEDDTDEN